MSMARTEVTTHLYTIKGGGALTRETIADSTERPLDHVKRQFQASRPNELRVADFTYGNSEVILCSDARSLSRGEQERTSRRNRASPQRDLRRTAG